MLNLTSSVLVDVSLGKDGARLEVYDAVLYVDVQGHRLGSKSSISPGCA